MEQVVKKVAEKIKDFLEENKASDGGTVFNATFSRNEIANVTWSTQWAFNNIDYATRLRMGRALAWDIQDVLPLDMTGRIEVFTARGKVCIKYIQELYKEIVI